MSSPAIIMGGYDPGAHNATPTKAARRVKTSQIYRDVSTVCIIPTRGMIPARVVESWWALMTPMNHKFVRIIVRGFEVGDAYNQAIHQILNQPELSTWPYILTLEEDNLPPPDGLLKLLESMGKHPEYDAIGGLYWTKGHGGMPMIYGDPKATLAFNPQAPKLNQVQECNGLGMGFTLFRTDLFRRIEAPWFVTRQEWSPNGGGVQYTQDLWFFERARRAGVRVACDTSVKVGHLDPNTDQVW